MLERVLVHIGTPKAGSTSLQAFFGKNRDALINQGIFIPRAAFNQWQHLELPLLVEGPRRARLQRLQQNKETPETRRTRFHTMLKEEIAQHPYCHTLLFYSEHIFGSDVRAVSGYRELFSQYASALECVAYVRRQDQWLASLSLQARKTASRRSFELGSGSPDRYLATFQAWHANASTFHVRRLETKWLREGSLLKDFCHLARIRTDTLDMDVPHANRAILQEQFELVDALNMLLKDMVFAQQVRYRSRFIALSTEVLGGSAVQYSRDSAEAAFQAYTRPNTWLRETFDPQGPPLFFETDFREYPEVADNSRSYSMDQLSCFLASISKSGIELGLPASEPPSTSRNELIYQIVSWFVFLRAAEIRNQSRNAPQKEGVRGNSASIGQRHRFQNKKFGSGKMHSYAGSDTPQNRRGKSRYPSA